MSAMHPKCHCDFISGPEDVDDVAGDILKYIGQGTAPL